MNGLIVLSALVTATTTDLLQGTRLQTVPAGGFLTFEFSCDQASASQNFTVSIQMPNGDTPLNSVIIPAATTSGSIDDREKLMVTLPVAQGGHPVVSLTETGTVNGIYRITYTPA
jgi:hypothetical protein